jgi:hypothetical protein
MKKSYQKIGNELVALDQLLEDQEDLLEQEKKIHLSSRDS